MQSVRIIEIPDCKVVSSGIGMFGEEKFDRFDEWMSGLPRGIFPKDFLFFDQGREKAGFHWIYLYEEQMSVPEEFEIIDFRGGLYAVATDIDQRTDMDALNAEVDAFLEENGLVRDTDRPNLGNIVSSPAASVVLGYEQMDYYAPVKKRE